MSGHSKWATTKHKKAAIDARRGKLFSKLIKNVEVAARMGGPDPDGNPTLYDAVFKAKKNSVPNDNIERAIKRGAGLEEGGADYQNIQYEGYGPHGVAILIECLTDNRNRAASDVRSVMSRNNGTMANPGSVSYLFARKGVIHAKKSVVDEEKLMSIALDSGGEDFDDVGKHYEIIVSTEQFEAVKKALKQENIEYESAEITFVPQSSVQLDVDGVQKIIKIITELEECDDVQNVWTNFDASDEVLGSV